MKKINKVLEFDPLLQIYLNLPLYWQALNETSLSQYMIFIQKCPPFKYFQMTFDRAGNLENQDDKKEQYNDKKTKKYFNLGNQLLEQRQFLKALEQYKKATIQSKIQSFKLCICKIKTLIKLEDYKQALTQIQEAFFKIHRYSKDVKNKYHSLMYQDAIYHMQTDNYTEAIKSFKWCNHICPYDKGYDKINKSIEKCNILLSYEQGKYKKPQFDKQIFQKNLLGLQECHKLSFQPQNDIEKAKVVNFQKSLAKAMSEAGLKSFIDKPFLSKYGEFVKALNQNNCKRQFMISYEHPEVVFIKVLTDQIKSDFGQVNQQQLQEEKLSQEDNEVIIQSIAYFQQGLKCFKAKKYQQALQFSDKALKKYPFDAYYYCNRAAALQKLWKLKKADQCIHDGFLVLINHDQNEIQGKFSLLFQLKADIYIKMDMQKEAVKFLKYSWVIDPKNFKQDTQLNILKYDDLPNQKLSHQQMQEEKQVQSEKYKVQHFKKDVCKAENHKKQGDNLMKEKTYEKAIQSFQKAIEFDPSNYSYYSLKSKAQFLMKRYQQAIETVDIGLFATKSEKNFKKKGQHSLKYRKAMVLMLQQNYEQAARILKNCLSKKPPHQLLKLMKQKLKECHLIKNKKQ